MSHENLTRREMLRTGAALAAGTVLAGSWSGGPSGRAAAAETEAAAPPRKRALRIAHLTDVHVQPELAADQGMIACLHHVQELKDKPDFILSGGDSIMDALAVSADRTTKLWKLWHSALRQECSLSVEPCIGNHDIWGWAKDKAGASGDELNFGKAWALEALGLDHPYRSFDRGGWHFVALDGVQHSQTRLYEARLDEGQFAWLANDLAKVDPKTPICIFSHIPIMCAGIVFFSKKEQEGQGDYLVPGHLIHLDAVRLKNLFAKHPNVRLCLSGHIHLVDRIDYNGVTYMCNGAVSGAWWKGKHYDCEAGYAVLDLYDDGSFEREYITYGWEPRKA